MIDILLAVYNGEKFISRQIDSILAQSYTDWHLSIRDDCSSDNTFEVVEAYAERYPEKIKAHKNHENSGSASANFFSMLSESRADYAMTCDQDDYWLPDKLQVTLQEMERLEANSRIPVLVHTDLKPVDVDLNEIAPSMFQRQNLDFRRDKLNYLLAQNIITGCTMMVNKPLLDYFLAKPSFAIMHDWWFGLAAAAFGRIGFVNKPTILYRQHSGNQVGAKDAKSASYLAKRAGEGQSNKQILYDTYLQAEAFADMYGDVLGNKQLRLINAYAEMQNKTKFAKIIALFRNKFWKYSLVRKIGQIIYC